MNPYIDRGSATVVPMRRGPRDPMEAGRDPFGRVISQRDGQAEAPEAVAPERLRSSQDLVPMGRGPFDEQWCCLFGVDIAGFNGSRRDNEIQAYVRKSLYEVMQAAFDRSGVPWDSCIYGDRGDGMLVVVPSTLPVAGLVAVPDKLRSLIRRHNRLSSEAAGIQLRAAMHAGLIHEDDHGFVGQDVNLLARLLDSRLLKRMLAESRAEVVFIASDYVYRDVIRSHPSLVDPALFKQVKVQVKETRTRAWTYTPGVLTRASPGLMRPVR